MKKALLIIGHGSRAADAQETFREIVRLVRDLSGFKYVEGAFLQLCSPSIEEQIERLSRMGIGEITLVPHFLYNGIHIQEDIPRIVREIARTHAPMRFKIADPIGAAPELAQLLLKRAQSAADFYEDAAV
jgi:sirohydrochlorin ferrochelatase